METESIIKSWSKPLLVVLSSKQTLTGCDSTKVDGTDDGIFPGFSCHTIS